MVALEVMFAVSAMHSVHCRAQAYVGAFLKRTPDPRSVGGQESSGFPFAADLLGERLGVGGHCVLCACAGAGADERDARVEVWGDEGGKGARG